MIEMKYGTLVVLLVLAGIVGAVMQHHWNRDSKTEVLSSSARWGYSFEKHLEMVNYMAKLLDQERERLHELRTTHPKAD